MITERLIGAYCCHDDNFMGLFICDDFGNLVQIQLGSVTFYSLFETGVYPRRIRPPSDYYEN